MKAREPFLTRTIFLLITLLTFCILLLLNSCTPSNEERMLVTATNGERGYIFVSEMNKLTSSGGSAAPEDQIKSAEAQGERIALAFKEAAAEHYGADLLSVEDARHCAQFLETSEKISGTQKALIKCLSSPLQEAIQSGTISRDRVDFLPSDNAALGDSAASYVTVSEETVEALYNATKKKTAVAVPVYMPPAKKTVVGEYMVDII